MDLTNGSSLDLYKWRKNEETKNKRSVAKIQFDIFKIGNTYWTHNR